MTKSGPKQGLRPGALPTGTKPLASGAHDVPDVTNQTGAKPVLAHDIKNSGNAGTTISRNINGG